MAARQRLLDAIRRAEKLDTEWVEGLLVAFDAPAPAERDALVNERLSELDERAQRWARIPRVCASVATSVGFLLGSLALVQGLSSAVEDGAPDQANAAAIAALDVLAVGLAGATSCYALHTQARRLLRDRLAAVDRLVSILDRSASGGPA